MSDPHLHQIYGGKLKHVRILKYINVHIYEKDYLTIFITFHKSLKKYILTIGAFSYCNVNHNIKSQHTFVYYYQCCILYKYLLTIKKLALHFQYIFLLQYLSSCNSYTPNSILHTLLCSYRNILLFSCHVPMDTGDTIMVRGTDQKALILIPESDDSVLHSLQSPANVSKYTTTIP
jgi:hypothetical protein